jgi:SAM-dependent methyltransferase
MPELAQASHAALQALLSGERSVLMRAVSAEPAGISLWLNAFGEPTAKGMTTFGLDPQVPLTLDANGDLYGAWRATANLWPTSDSAFSFVILQHALDYAPEPEELLAEAVRSLRGHGVLVICGFRSASPLRFSKSWRPSFRTQSPRFASANGWARTCKALGIADIRIHRMAPIWPWLKNAAAEADNHWLARHLPHLCSAYVLIGRKRSLRGNTIAQRVKPKRTSIALEPAQAMHHRAKS